MHGTFPSSRPTADEAARAVVAREQLSLAAHRALLRGSELPPAKTAPRATFLHGFLLPFSLIVSTLRHPTLGQAYLRLTVVRALFVAVFAFLAVGPLMERRADENDGHVRVVRTPPRPDSSQRGDNVHLHAPGFHVDIDDAKGKPKVVVLGNEIPVVDQNADRSAKTDHAGGDDAPGKTPAIVKALSSSWSWIVWFVGILSATEAFVVFFSRRWDDWLSFHASSFARIMPEELQPKPRRIAFDVRWLFKKLKRRVRGYIVFGAGVPLLALLQLVPVIGQILFSIALTIWGWYWLAIFTAAKSAHAWADVADAPSPFLIRELRDRAVGKWWLMPVSVYARIWARLTRTMNAPASAFERNPTPFFGLALARAILSLPGLYLLGRPFMSVAAGRLCAESDPRDRFSLEPWRR